MNYLKYTFVASEDLKDELIAQVGEFPFDTFEDTENGFSAYIPEKEITSEIDTAIQLLSMSYGVTFEKEVILGQNWNEVWESNFQPILIDDFCAIRAEFHPHYPEFPIELTIAPKMAFGTGHHETTYMMIQGMKSLDLKNKKVLDYGCGTGILAMVASKLGATWIDAVDHEFPAYENTIEHNEMNGVTNVTAIHGTLESVTGDGYHIILANINRNVILENLDLLMQKVRYGTTILFSGFLQEDEKIMTDAFKSKDLVVQKVNQRGKWLCIQAQYLPTSIPIDKTEGFDRFPDVNSEVTPQKITSVSAQENKISFLKDNDFSLDITFINEQIFNFRLKNTFDPEPEFSYSIDEDFILHQSDVTYKLTEEADLYRVTLQKYQICVRKEDLKITILDNQNQLIVQNSHQPYNLKYSIHKGYYSCSTNLEITPETYYFGLGDKTGNLCLNGYKYTNWCTDAFGFHDKTDELYRSIPFFISQKFNATFGFFFDNTYRSHFDFGATNPEVLKYSAEGGELNYYFIGGKNQIEVIQNYTQLTGLSALPPIWALGYHQCRWSYFPESRVLEVAEKFREEQIPCDAIYLDIDYMEEYKCFTWNKTYFPDPKKKIDYLKSIGFQTIAMIDPGIKVEKNYIIFESGLQQNAFCRRSNGQLMVGPVWPTSCVFPDFTHPEVRNWWGKCYEELYITHGISGFWNDMNEPAVFKVDNLTFPNEVIHHFEGYTTNHAKAHNIYGMMMAKASWEGMEKLNPNKRPFLLTRSNFSGGQRYAAIWTGDNVASWEHLRLANIQMQRLAMSGYSFAGSDIGGFVDQPDAELMIRWMQLAVFHTFMRTHFMGNKDHGSSEVDLLTILASESKNRIDREPWSFGNETTKYLKSAINMRYQLLGVVYTAFYHYSKNGTPIIKPLFLELPLNNHSITTERDFIFGDHLLVSPILESKQEKQIIHFPAGDWYDIYTNQKYSGNEEKSVEISLDNIPFFVRAGAIIPILPVRQHTGEEIQEMKLNIYFGKQNIESYLYEDEGEGYSYLNTAFAYTTYLYSVTESTISISRKKEGNWNQNYIQKVLLIGFDTYKNILVNDEKISVEKTQGLIEFVIQNDWETITIV